MVERTLPLDLIFGSLSDGTRRDILRRVAKQELPIKELVRSSSLSFAAIAKHVNVLERAHLVRKRKAGREQIVSIVPQTFKRTQKYLRDYEKIWEARYQNLDSLLNQ